METLDEMAADLIGEMRGEIRALKAEFEIGKAAEASVTKYREYVTRPKHSGY
jgi:hypothetical protein